MTDLTPEQERERDIDALISFGMVTTNYQRLITGAIENQEWDLVSFLTFEYGEALAIINEAIKPLAGLKIAERGEQFFEFYDETLPQVFEDLRKGTEPFFAKWEGTLDG